MYKEKFDTIYKLIKSHENIVIARHIGVDPDAMASQIGLKEGILKAFPDKHVYAVGTGAQKFTYLGKLDALPEDLHDALLIVTDTPDKKRVDGVEDFSCFKDSIKIDHHPFMEKYCDFELINDKASSASEIVIDLLTETPLGIDKDIAYTLFIGLVSDTDRFLFSNSKPSTFRTVAKLLEDYDIDITKAYEELYARPMSEVRLQGYINENMSITEHGVGYILLSNEIINKYGCDVATPGNLVNSYNNINELLVWLTLTEDLKNNQIKVSIRSRGPVVNEIAERYNGGGHKMAAGARIHEDEEIQALINELDNACKEYKNENN